MILDKARIIVNRILDDIKKNWVPIVIILTLWIGLNLWLHRFCPLVLFCGFPCPGCGITRAFISFFTLHPIKAFEYNPVYPLWLVSIIAAIWRRYISGKSLKAIRWLFTITALLTLAVYVWRMATAFPSQEPMVFVHENLMSTLFPSYDSFMTGKFGR